LGSSLSGAIGLGGTGTLSLSGGQDVIFTVVNVIPEPTTGLLAAMGLAFVTALHRRRRN